MCGDQSSKIILDMFYTQDISISMCICKLLMLRPALKYKVEVRTYCIRTFVK